MGQAAISVDLDSLHHYCRIHGLPESLLDDRARRLVYEVAVPRFLALFRETGVPATLFAIGEDLADPAAGRALRTAVGQGLEVGNHSHTHDYALSRKSPDAIAGDLATAARVIAEAAGQAPVGFRAPGYTLSPALYGALEQQGYLYDASTFPAAPYWLAKAGVMAALALRGRPSRAVLDSPAVLAAPLAPYRPDPAAPYRRGRGRVIELPVSVTPGLRLPFIGFFVLQAPMPWVRSALRALLRQPLLNFELHAVDLLDASDGIPAALVRAERDLAIPVRAKEARLRELFGAIAATGAARTLEQVARSLALPA